MLHEPTVFVVDDDAAMRESLRWLIQSVGLPVETYAAAEDFLAAYDPAWPGCLVLDVRMPGMSGLSLQEELVARQVDLPVIVLTGYAVVASAVRALKAGALDFIEKPFSDQLLIERIQQAIAYDRQARQVRAEREEAAGLLAQLSPREQQVADRLVAGKANKVIAAELGLSERTIEIHRAHVMKRLRVDSVAQLVHLVLRAEGGNQRRPE